MRRHVVYCCPVGHSVNEIDEVRNLVDRLSEEDEIWLIVRALLYIDAEIGKLWSWGPAIPCGDMHQSFTDALVSLSGHWQYYFQRFSVTYLFCWPLLLTEMQTSRNRFLQEIHTFLKISFEHNRSVDLLCDFIDSIFHAHAQNLLHPEPFIHFLDSVSYYRVTSIEYNVRLCITGLVALHCHAGNRR